jgi:hypothetical protein
MKTGLVTLAALLSFAFLVPAQNRFVDALATLNVEMLKDTKSDRQEDIIHRELVLETIAIARRANVQIEREAASPLDKLYADASMVVAKEPPNSDQRKLFPANRSRLIARLISLAEPTPENARVSWKTVEFLRKELEAGVRGFCPCWPFCK